MFKITEGVSTTTKSHKSTATVPNPPGSADASDQTYDHGHEHMTAISKPEGVWNATAYEDLIL